MDSAALSRTGRPRTATTVVPVTRPVIQVVFGPDGRIAMRSSAWVREYDPRTRETRPVATSVGNGTLSYNSRTGEPVLSPDDAPAAPAVSDADARERLAAAGIPFVAVQRNTIRTGPAGPTYVAWTHSVSTILAGTILHGPVLVTPERIVPLSKSETSVRVIMDGNDVYLVERSLATYARVTVTRLGDSTGFAVPHERDLSSWTSVVRTPRHALVAGHHGHLADLRFPDRVLASDWHIEGEPRRLPGGAAVAARRDRDGAIIWLHEEGVDCFPATSPLESLVRTGPHDLTGWHMRGATELVVRTYSLSRD